MLQYIKDYIRLQWYIGTCEGLKTKQLNRSIAELARNANPDYRAEKGGKWMLLVNGMLSTYGNHQFWVPYESTRCQGAEKIIGKEEYRDGKLYKRSYLVAPDLNNKMVTEYIK
ncbi:hypothetical protein Spock_230 [Bacillus phage Spock]|uniref:Uncharacterized protein n=1 Tax=Bacillus phage Spock TaxID=1406791 RepID=U5PXA2_9CAUD|nr:hypothetical protein Spock_230 [Bacillus phage Spock]AGY48630.1 hypothetical protein Spock_230 [Bacillus phage Spock]